MEPVLFFAEDHIQTVYCLTGGTIETLNRRNEWHAGYRASVQHSVTVDFKPLLVKQLLSTHATVA